MQSSQLLSFNQAIYIAGKKCICSSPQTVQGATGPIGPTGPEGPGGWSFIPATTNVDISCNNLLNTESLQFCDNTYIGPGGSFDISSNQKIVITSTSGANPVSLIVDGSDNFIQNYTYETISSPGTLNGNSTISYISGTPQTLSSTNIITGLLKIIVNTSGSAITINSAFLQNGTVVSSISLDAYSVLRVIWNGSSWCIL